MVERQSVGPHNDAPRDAFTSCPRAQIGALALDAIAHYRPLFAFRRHAPRALPLNHHDKWIDALQTRMIYLRACSD